MELTPLSELPSQILLPFITESTIKLYQIGQKSLVKAKIANIGLNFLDYIQGRLSENDQHILAIKFSNPIAYNPVKSFGPFMLVETTCSFDFYDHKTNFRLKKGQAYLAIHLGDKGGTRATKKEIDDSIAAVARYVGYNKDKLPGNTVVGITYNKLASAARRYGFSLAETPLPPKVQRDSTNALKDLQERIGMDVANINLCFQSYDNLIERFAPKAKPLK